MPKPKIYCDVDGCIADFMQDFEVFISEEFEILNIDKSRYDMGIKDPEKVAGLVNEFFEDWDISKVAHFPGARESFNKIAKHCDIHMATKIAKKFEDRRKKNLQGFKYTGFSSICPCTSKAKHLSIIAEPGIIIEDHPSEVKAFVKLGWQVFVPTFYKYTEEVLGLEGVTPFNSWKELPDLVISSLENL